MEWLSGLAWGVGSFVIVTGIVILLLDKFATNTLYYNGSDYLATNSSTAFNYGMQQMGSSGLLGWVGIIVVIVIAAFVMGYFGLGGGKSKR